MSPRATISSALNQWLRASSFTFRDGFFTIRPLRNTDCRLWVQEVRRLREQKEWTQAELAYHAGLAPSVISEIETGKRDPGAGTLKKLASALNVAVPELFGRNDPLKAEPPLPFDDVVEERGRGLSEAFDAYIRSRAAAHKREVQDPDSPHFRDATAAALWLAMLDEERTALVDAILDEARPLMRRLSAEERGLLAMQLLWPVGRLAGVALQAEERLDGMSDQPDEVADRRREKARVAVKKSERRRAALQATGS
jgi:transcriptional regulator with XRE-family HTH domain